MNYNEIAKIGAECLLPTISKLYGLNGYEIKMIAYHYGGRNLVYTCERTGSNPLILRVSYLNDRTQEDYLGEVEYVRFLFENGGSVSNVVISKSGNLLEKLVYNGEIYYISLFEKAKGKMLVENNYQYRKNVPISEYYYNCGKTLGKIHQLSKEYTPNHSRFSFFERYNETYIEQLIPHEFTLLKKKFQELIKTFKSIENTNEIYGMIHCDFNDGNYSIDFDNGEITVYDFDNSCFGFYMYDLADLWTNGVGWIQFEQDATKRMKFMDDYFETVLAGYQSETNLDNSMLHNLPLFINATIMENIIDGFEIMKRNGEELECEEDLLYLIKCIEDDIPYKGFFNDIYSCEMPFELRC